MEHICPHCHSNNTRSIGGEDHDNIQCDDCNKLSVVTWANYKARAAQLEGELAAVLERERVELIEWAARVNEQFKHRLQTQLELDTARADIVRYQDERVILLGRIEALAAELQAQRDSDNRFIRDLSEALNSGDGAYRP